MTPLNEGNYGPPVIISGITEGLSWDWIQGQGLRVYKGQEYVVNIVWAGSIIKPKYGETGRNLTPKQIAKLGEVVKQCRKQEQPLVEKIGNIAATYARMTLSLEIQTVQESTIYTVLSDDNPKYRKALDNCIILVRNKLGLWDDEDSPAYTEWDYGGWDEAFKLYSNTYNYGDEVELSMIEALRPFVPFEFSIPEIDIRNEEMDE